MYCSTFPCLLHNHQPQCEDSPLKAQLPYGTRPLTTQDHSHDHCHYSLPRSLQHHYHCHYHLHLHHQLRHLCRSPITTSSRADQCTPLSPTNPTGQSTAAHGKPAPQKPQGLILNRWWRWRRVRQRPAIRTFRDGSLHRCWDVALWAWCCGFSPPRVRIPRWALLQDDGIMERRVS